MESDGPSKPPKKKFDQFQCVSKYSQYSLSLSGKVFSH